MLRLNIYCSLVSHTKKFKTGISHGSWSTHEGAWKPSPTIMAKALKDEADGGVRRFTDRSWDPGLEIEVPFEQRPVLLLNFKTVFVQAKPLHINTSLKDGPFYSWGDLGARPFFIRLGGLWLLAFTVLGAPIAAASFSPYEESGWYDGQMWVKPPEILARDRLLGSYKVKPVIKLLKQTLVGTGVVLVTAVLLFLFATPAEEFFDNVFSANNFPTSNTSTRSNIRKEELLRLPSEVMTDDDMAAAAAEAAKGRPVYCTDRFYRALAGGQYCKWEDLIK